jgi:hypothetical protein
MEIDGHLLNALNPEEPQETVERINIGSSCSKARYSHLQPTDRRRCRVVWEGEHVPIASMKASSEWQGPKTERFEPLTEVAPCEVVAR